MAGRRRWAVVGAVVLVAAGLGGAGYAMLAGAQPQDATLGAPGAGGTSAGVPTSDPASEVTLDPAERSVAAESAADSPLVLLPAGPPIERAQSGPVDLGEGALDLRERLRASAEKAARPGRAPRGGQQRRPARQGGSEGSPDRACTPAGTTTLRVATYNIKGGQSRTGGYDLEAIADDIRGWDADVVLLQEVYRAGRQPARRDQPARLGSMLGMESAFGYNARKGSATQYGTAVLSRYPMLETSNDALPNRGGLEQRGLLRATLDVAGVSVDVFDTHLQNLPQAADLRTSQARAIAASLGGRRDATGNPAVLGGDFNSSPNGPVAAALRTVLGDTWSAVGAGQGATAPARRPRARIDRLYHSADLAPLAAAVGFSATSDHHAVVADYEVPALGCEE